MIKIKDLKEIVDILEKDKIKYWIFGGVATDGLRNKFTRPHKDIDIYVRSTDCRKFLKLLQSHQYKCYKEGNKYSAIKNSSNLEIVRLVHRPKDKMFAAYSNRKITYYPEAIFRKYSQTKLENTVFNIAPNEVLAFKSQFSIHDADKNIIKKLDYDKSLEDKISYKKIVKEAKPERIIIK